MHMFPRATFLSREDVKFYNSCPSFTVIDFLNLFVSATLTLILDRYQH